MLRPSLQYFLYPSNRRKVFRCDNSFPAESSEYLLSQRSLTPSREVTYALDHFRDSADYVVARIGEFLHLRRIHPSVAGAGRDRSDRQPAQRTQNRSLK